LYLRWILKSVSIIIENGEKYKSFFRLSHIFYFSYGIFHGKGFLFKEIPANSLQKEEQHLCFLFLQKISDFPSSAPLIKRHAERG